MLVVLRTALSKHNEDGQSKLKRVLPSSFQNEAFCNYVSVTSFLGFEPWPVIFLLLYPVHAEKHELYVFLALMHLKVTGGFTNILRHYCEPRTLKLEFLAEPFNMLNRYLVQVRMSVHTSSTLLLHAPYVNKQLIYNTTS